MRRKQKWKLFLAGILMVATILTTGIQAYAYFTTNTQASGGILIKGIETGIREKVANGTKQIVVFNSENGIPVYVRARGFCKNNSEALSYSGTGWNAGNDGWMYYETILLPTSATGGTISETTPLDIDISKVLPQNAERGEEFNVVVIYEAIPASGVSDSPQDSFNAFVMQQTGGDVS